MKTLISLSTVYNNSYYHIRSSF